MGLGPVAAPWLDVVDPTLRHAAKDAEAVPMGVEQHLVGLQQIGAHQECPAVCQLDMRDLQLRALAADHGIILTPVELESFTRAEGQRNKSAASRCLLFSLPLCTPFTGEGSNPVVGAGKPQCDQIGMELRQGAPLLARLRGLGLQPGCQFVGERVELAGPLRHREPRLDRARLQILPDRVA